MITCAIRIKLMLDAAMYMLEALPTIHEFRHNPLWEDVCIRR